MKKIMVIIIIAGILLGSVFYIVQTRTDKEKEVRGYQVTKSNYQEIVSGIGYVVYDKEIVVRSEVGGMMKQMTKSVSDRANKDEVLFYVDDKEAKDQYDRLEAKVQLAQANLDDYKSNYSQTYKQAIGQRDLYDEEKEKTELEIQQLSRTVDKTKKLVEAGISPQNDLDTLLDKESVLEQSLETIEAKKQASSLPVYADSGLKVALANAKQEVLQQESELAKYTTLSPVDGLVIESYVEDGELIQPGQDIMKIASDKKKYILVDIDEKYTMQLHKNDPVKIIDSSDTNHSVEGKIEELSPVVDLETGTIQVKIQILDKLDLFIKNMSVQVDFTMVDFNNVTVVPGQYLLAEEELYVLLQDESGKVVKKKVNAYNQNMPNVYITEGLTPDDVLLNPQEVSEGERVQVISGEADR